MEEHREDAKWLVKTLDELLPNTSEAKAQEEQRKLDDVLKVRKNENLVAIISFTKIFCNEQRKFNRCVFSEVYNVSLSLAVLTKILSCEKQCERKNEFVVVFCRGTRV